MNTPRLAGEAARRLAGADSPARARQSRAATVPRSGSLIGALPGRKACVPSGTAGPAHAVPVTTSPDVVPSSRTSRRADTDRSKPSRAHGRSVRSWPLWLLAAGGS